MISQRFSAGFGLLLALLVSMAVCSGVSRAADAASLQVNADEPVVYCDTSIVSGDEMIEHALKDGIQVTAVWDLSVGRVRKYWLNESVAKIQVVRKVVPDLLSKSWHLIDETSGISRRTLDMHAAIRFLTGLDRYPLLDRSLLMKGMPYLLTADLELHIGEVEDAWWSKLWRSEFANLKQEFALP